MSWADDFYAGTYDVKTSNIGGTAETYWSKKFLTAIRDKLRMAPLGQPRPLPKYSGKTIDWRRYLPIGKNITSATLTEGVNPSATTFSTQSISATIKEYGAFGKITSLLADTFRDPEVKGAVGQFAEHGAGIVDLLTHMEVASNGGYPMRADLDKSCEFKGTVDGAGSLYFYDAELLSNTDYGDADDDLNQSVVIITSGTGYGQARAITDYDATGGAYGEGQCTISPAWDTTPANGDNYTVVTFDDINAGDDFMASAMKRAVARLRDNKASTGESDYYVAVVDPFTIEGIQNDSAWTEVGLYADHTSMFKGEVGKRWGIRFILETQPFRFPVTARGTAGTSYGPGATGANYSSSGSVTMVPVLGKEAYGVTRLVGEGGTVDKPMIYIRKPGPNSTDQPLPRFSTVGWMTRFVAKALNPMFCVNVAVYNRDAA